MFFFFFFYFYVRAHTRSLYSHGSADRKRLCATSNIALTLLRFCELLHVRLRERFYLLPRPGGGHPPLPEVSGVSAGLGMDSQYCVE